MFDDRAVADLLSRLEKGGLVTARLSNSHPDQSSDAHCYTFMGIARLPGQLHRRLDIKVGAGGGRRVGRAVPHASFPNTNTDPDLPAPLLAVCSPLFHGLRPLQP